MLTPLFLCLPDDLFVGPDDVLAHLPLHLFLYRRNRNQSAYQLHLQDALLLLLREIINAMFLVKFMIGLHQAPHDINQVPEDFHATHAIEVHGAGQALVQREGQRTGQGPDGGCRIALVRGHAAQIVAAHLAAGLHNHAQVAFVLIVAADEVGDGGAVGDGAVAVAELAVVIALEARVRVVVGDGEGVDDGVRGLYLRAQEVVKAAGLGLALGRLIMEKMNGSLMLDDKYTEGCRFVLTLPIK